MPRFEVLGQLTATESGYPLALRGPVQRRLLAILLAFPNQAVSHDRLVEALWPERPPQQPEGAVQTLVSRARRLVGEEVITTQPGGYLLRTDAGELDSLQFEQLVSTARATRVSDPHRAVELFTEAAALWRGQAFEGVGDLLLVQPVVTRLESARLSSVEERAELLLALGRCDEASASLGPVVESQPDRERLVTLLMRAHYACGRHAEAMAVSAFHRRHLAEELGLDPSPEVHRLEERILRHEMEPPAAPPTVSPAPRPAVLPEPRRPAPRPRRRRLYGRDGDVKAVGDLVGPGRRVTVVGVGGVGKTSLSLEVAATTSERYSDGVLFCELAKAADEDGVFLAVADAAARAFGTQTSGRDFLLHDLATRHALFILDNCEHVLTAVAALVENLLSLSPTIAVLATSRERLRVHDETVWHLAPLTVNTPEQDHLSDAARLFTDRATATGTRLASTDQPVIEDICRRLDGLPLAIELAAARTNTLTPHEIRDGLTDRFALLGLGRRIAEHRHQSLTSVVEWSYTLLTPTDQTTFNRLAVFPGDFDLHAAVDIAATPHAVDSILHLVECSLLQRSTEGTHSRYHLLDTLRDYGQRNLRTHNLTRTLADDHANTYLRLVQEAETERSAMREWFPRIDRELGNIRAARKHFDQTGDIPNLLKLSSLLHHYGYHTLRPEIVKWAEDAVRRSGTRETEDYGAALATVALGAWLVGDTNRAKRLATESVEICCRFPTHKVWYGLDILGDVAVREGDIDAAAQIYQRYGDLSGVGIEEYQAVLHSGSWAITLCLSGRVEQAREALLGTKALMDKAQSVDLYALRALAEYEIARHSGDLAATREWSTRAVRLADESGSSYLMIAAWTAAAAFETETGCIQDSARKYQTLIGRWPSLGAEVALALTLRGVLELLGTTSRHAEAATLYGAMLGSVTSSELAEVSDEFRLVTSLTAEAEHPVAAVRAALGEPAFLDAVRRGRELPRTSLISEVNDWLADLADQAR